MSNVECRDNISSRADPLEALGQRSRLVGLQSVAHLNGKEGGVKLEDPNTHWRVDVRLEGGEQFRVKGTNLKRI